MGCGCCSKNRLPADKHIVIVGAGFAGIKLAEELMKYENANFTLINPRDEFIQNVAGCRAGVEEGLAPKTMVPLAPAFGSHFLKGRVVSINSKSKTITLGSGQVMSYDVLVICTGTGGPFPFKIDIDTTTEEAVRKYEATVTKAKNSNSFVVIGGGATGTEMAGELASKYPKKSVTLVTSASHLVPSTTVDKFKNKVRKMLTAKGVKIIFDERVTNIEEVSSTGVGPVKTNKGSVLEADCVFNCMGLKVNSDAYSNGLASSMDNLGRLRVNEFLQVDGYTDIFALGDCCDTEEPKLGYVAGLHGTWLGSQLKDYFDGEKIKPYAVGDSPIQMALALGPDTGTGLTKGGWILPSFFIVAVKGTLLVPETWKQLKQKMPK